LIQGKLNAKSIEEKINSNEKWEVNAVGKPVQPDKKGR